MNKIFGSIFLLFVGVQSTIAQIEGVTMEDFNHDGVQDSLKVWYDGGSGFGGYYAKAINGKTGKIYELDTWDCFCEIRTIIPLPLESKNKEDAPFYKAIEHALFEDIRNEFDPTLEWIIQANLKAIVPDENEFFDLVLPVGLNWVDAEIQNPSNYQILIDDLLIKFMYSPSQEPEAWTSESQEGYLTYFPHNLKLRMKESQLNGAESMIIQGKHSLILNNIGKEAVLFITDHPLTSGPEKLREISISHFETNGEYLFFTLSEAPEPSYRIFLVHLKSGSIGRLNMSIEGYSGVFGIEEDNFFNSEGEVVIENISQLIASFNLLNPLFK